MTGRLKIVGEKFIDLGNFIAVALVFGQISSEKKETLVIVIGLALTLFFWILGWTALGRRVGGLKR